MEYNIKNHHELFYTILKSIKIKSEEELDSYVHALIDIDESLVKINSLVDEIIKNEKNTDLIREKLWDIREEFRHIEYHINDAKLSE